jgi:hypothetical protein
MDPSGPLKVFRADFPQEAAGLDVIGFFHFYIHIVGRRVRWRVALTHNWHKEESSRWLNHSHGKILTLEWLGSNNSGRRYRVKLPQDSREPREKPDKDGIDHVDHDDHGDHDRRHGHRRDGLGFVTFYTLAGVYHRPIQSIFSVYPFELFSFMKSRHAT